MKSVAYWRRWQRGPGSIYWVFACAFSALVLLGGWAAIAGLLRWQWQETLQAEMRQNTNTALALKEHTLRILDTVDQAMLRLGRGVEAAGFDSREVVRIANETGMVPHILTQLSFVGSDGRFVGSNLDPDGTRSQHVSLMERDHIRVHLAPSVSSLPPPGMLHDGLFISQALRGKVSGVWAIQMSRKVVSVDGRTLGVVVASLNQSHFTDLYRGVELGSQGGGGARGAGWRGAGSRHWRREYTDRHVVARILGAHIANAGSWGDLVGVFRQAGARHWL